MNIIQRPKNITDEQWDKALELYNTAKAKGDKYPELTVAQAALETGWFKNTSGNYNYFGQKATASQKGKDLQTKEVLKNKEYSTKQRFREYDSLSESLDDRMNKWGSKYKDAQNVDEAISKIWQYDKKTGQGKGYATDINYGGKLKGILGMMGVNLQQDNNTQQNQEVSSQYTPIDFSTPTVSGGMTFSQEEVAQKEEQKKPQEQTSAEKLNTESFLRDYQDLVVQQPQIQQQQRQFVEVIQPIPIEYTPTEVFMQDGGNFPTFQNLEVKKSPIQGKGVFTKNDINQDIVIGLSHSNGQPITGLGKMYNHSEKPNTESVKIGNDRFLKSLRKIKQGEEITVNYKNQPELEQPSDFKV